MYLERPEAAAGVTGAPPQPELEFETTAQAGDNDDEEEVPDAALYEFLQPAQVREDGRAQSLNTM